MSLHHAAEDDAEEKEDDIEDEELGRLITYSTQDTNADMLAGRLCVPHTMYA